MYESWAMIIKVCEIFHSLEGETTTAGFPAVFVRLAGCNLNCSYCDTAYARESGRDMDIEEVLDIVRAYGRVHHVTVTGGEPLIQENAPALIGALCEKGYNVQVETNGSISVKDLHPGARRILDVKTPSSGEGGSFLQENLKSIGSGDELKFVIGSEEDYRFSRYFIESNPELSGIVINFSPAQGTVSPKMLSSWILRDRLQVRLNLQMHKIIGLEESQEC